MMTSTRILIFAWLVAAVLFVPAALAQGESGRCAILYPKGGGTVVNGTFVPLQPGQYLKLCRLPLEKTT